MSDLFSLLSLGSAGIAAQNTGISVASNNVANANTEGYSRQRVALEALPGSPLVGGVRSNGADRMSDSLLGGRIRLASGSLAMSSAMADALDDIESRLVTGDSIGDNLASMFSAIGESSATPTDTISRMAVIVNTQKLVEGLHRRAAELKEVLAEHNQAIRDKTKQATVLAEQLASANLGVAKTNDPVVKDRRDELAKQLAEVVGGTARVDADGQMRFVLDGGAVLVDGTHAAKLEAGTDPTTANATVSVVDGNTTRDVTTALKSGSLGAKLVVRDGSLAKARNDLDQFAYDLADSMNTVHRANAGLDGVTGRDLFTPLGAVKDAATLIEVDPAIDADPSKLALGAPGGGQGSNTGALALFGLATQSVATGGKRLGEAAVDLVGSVAREAATARADRDRDSLVSEHLAGLRDSISGVDVQEELANLSRFEHASSAMTKFVSTIDGLLGNLIDQL